MLRFLIIAILCTCQAVALAQKETDYRNEKVLKELYSIVKQHNIALKEHLAPDAGFPLSGKYFAVTDNTSGNVLKYVYMGRVTCCRAGGCSINKKPHENANPEYFDYYILFNTSASVEKVKVFNYQATHGQEVTAKGWLKQFIGFSGERDLVVGKDVDAISGATISVNSLTFDVQEKTRLLKMAL